MNLQQATVRVNELSATRVTAAFYDQDGDASTPASIRYRLDDVTYGRGGAQEVLTWTAVGTPASSITIDITATQNRILNDANHTEKRQLTVEATDENGKVSRHGYLYEIDNFAGTSGDGS